MVKELAIQPVTGCPKSRDAQQAHTWEPGNGADLIAYGQPDLGVSIDLGRCQYCKIALLSVGEYYSEHSERSVIFEIRAAEL
jgi:hypothetical protein